MPMVENEEITGTMRGDGENDPVSEFIGNNCLINYIILRLQLVSGYSLL